jgi:D-alanyl-D-alanine carboxypeptidase-like protein/putative peptidoglycan binding protein
MADLHAAYGDPCREGTFVQVRIFGHEIPFVRAGANALLRAAMDAYDVDYRVHRIESYNCRRTTGGGSQSAHSWAAAVDVNPEQNPFSSKAILITDMPREFREAFKRHGLGWGGDWHSVKDAMHFSMDRGEQGKAITQKYDPDLQAAADQKWKGRPPATFTPQPSGTAAPPWKHEHPGNIQNPHNNCPTVRQWQAQMKARGWDIGVDSDYGDGSERVCRAFQREKRLAIDGIVGRNTWRMAWEAPIA